MLFLSTLQLVPLAVLHSGYMLQYQGLVPVVSLGQVLLHDPLYSWSLTPEQLCALEARRADPAADSSDELLLNAQSRLQSTASIGHCSTVLTSGDDELNNIIAGYKKPATNVRDCGTSRSIRRSHRGRRGRGVRQRSSNDYETSALRHQESHGAYNYSNNQLAERVLLSVRGKLEGRIGGLGDTLTCGQTDQPARMSTTSLNGGIGLEGARTGGGFGGVGGSGLGLGHLDVSGQVALLVRLAFFISISVLSCPPHPSAFFSLGRISFILAPFHLKAVFSMAHGKNTFPIISVGDRIYDLRHIIVTDDPRYPGLRKLKLRGKRLTNVPHQLYSLTDLQVLDLSPEREACLCYRLPELHPDIGESL
ncbi:unnamed protein product [Protopolystoma xenopodis]|uniref:Uncharacterized protein n=1 Tax=Protopolystoma xenopodis TaxID=117903 RepID=A0A3S5FBZ1_9PLAT|nr:unnamed protein product [Protopolystoma xenopodis]